LENQFRFRDHISVRPFGFAIDGHRTIHDQVHVRLVMTFMTKDVTCRETQGTTERLKRLNVD
jgi:hypothetical protein